MARTRFAGAAGSGMVSDEHTPEPWRRIVACLNACAGISTEQLERNVSLPRIARLDRFNMIEARLVRAEALLRKLIEDTDWVTRETSEWANSCAACGSIGSIDGDPHEPDCALVDARAFLFETEVKP